MLYNFSNDHKSGNIYLLPNRQNPKYLLSNRRITTCVNNNYVRLGIVWRYLCWDYYNRY